MKKALYILILILSHPLLMLSQTLDAHPDNIYTEQEQGHAKPIPYPFVRQSDIVWSIDLWKTINVSELFNHFFYFPNDEYHTYGKKSLAYIIWDAVVAG